MQAELKIIDIARSSIDIALKQGDMQTALATAKKLFPQRRRLLEGAMLNADMISFRELCGIQAGAEWVDNEFIPGPCAGHSRAVPEPAYQFDLPAAVEITKPVMFVGALCAVGAIVVTAIQAILTGLSAAFVVIGQIVGYVLAGLVVLYLLRAMFSRSAAAPEKPKATGGGIYVTNNFNIVGNDGTNSIQ